MSRRKRQTSQAVYSDPADFEFVYDYIQSFGGRAKFHRIMKTGLGLVNPRDPETRKFLQLREKLVRENYPIISDVISRMPNIKANADNYSAGAEGLLRAVESFNPHKGFRFSTYAYRVVYYALIEANSKNRMISIPQALQTKINAVKKATTNYETREITRVCKSLGYKEADIDLILSHFTPELVSLDEATYAA